MRYYGYQLKGGIGIGNKNTKPATTKICLYMITHHLPFLSSDVGVLGEVGEMNSPAALSREGRSTSGDLDMVGEDVNQPPGKKREEVEDP